MRQVETHRFHLASICFFFHSFSVCLVSPDVEDQTFFFFLQSSCSSPMRRLVGPSNTTTSQIQSSPPSKKRANPWNPRTVPVSKWTQFLSSDCQVQGGEGLPVTPWSQPMNGAASLSNDVSRPRPPLPGSSLFETGEEFHFEDEDFLTGPIP